MSKEHERRHERLVRDEIRILEMKPTGEGFEFAGVAAGGKTHHFLMTSETLQELTGGHGVQIDPARAFEQHRQQIYSVAARVFGAGVRGDPIVLKIGFFKPASA